MQKIISLIKILIWLGLLITLGLRRILRRSFFYGMDIANLVITTICLGGTKLNQQYFEASAMERLSKTSDDIELWWDSNPLVYETWCKKFLESAPDEIKDLIKVQLKKLWDENEDPLNWVFRGVTTNPPLTKAVFDDLGDEWAPIIKELIRFHPTMNHEQITWEAYKEACKRGSARYLNLYKKSEHTKGFVSAQVDPRLFTEPFIMVKQGLEIRSLQPNIMVKVPATQSGVLAIFLLTALGVPTNATLCFNMPQIMAVAQAVKRGKEIGENRGVDYSGWRSVITIMIGRFEDAKIFAEQAEERGIELTEEIKRWSGLAVTKKAYKILAERNYPSKLLIASSRVSPVVNGRQEIWHLEKLAGGNLVITMNPKLIQSFMLHYIDRPIENKIDEPIPENIMAKLLQIPYFTEGYGEDTIKPEDFETLEPTYTTYTQFSKAMIGLEDHIETIFNGAKIKAS